MSHGHREPSNLEAIDRFWRRRPFHDMVIEEVSAFNKRVVIRLAEFTLIVTGAFHLKRCELLAAWLYETIVERPGGFVLDVQTDVDHVTVTGVDLRLIRNSDLAMLIPPVDA